MRRRAMGVVLMTLAAVAATEARQSKTKPPAKRVSQTFTCSAELGSGVASKRRFCDVVIASAAARSVTIPIPARTGTATLMFDLHNRFTVSNQTDVAQAFARHVAVASVIRSSGDLIDQFAVSRDYRTPADLFDRIGGAARGAPPIAVAPGEPVPVKVTIPAGLTSIGIFSLAPQVMIYLLERGFEGAYAAQALAVAGFLMPLGMVGFSWLADRGGRRVAALLAYGSSIAGVGALALVRGPSDDLWPSEHLPKRLEAARAKFAEFLEHEVGNL